MTPTPTSGVHHIGLTVPDIRTSSLFFQETLGFREVGQQPDYPAVFVSDGVIMITLWQAQAPENAVAFDRHNIGLHHLALKVVSPEELMLLGEQLTAHPDVAIEFLPEQLGSSELQHMMCLIPGGIRLELIADKE